MLHRIQLVPLLALEGLMGGGLHAPAGRGARCPQTLLTLLCWRCRSLSKNNCVSMLPQRKLNTVVQDRNNKEWFDKRDKQAKTVHLPAFVNRLIAEWFELVDDDGSRTLEHEELLAALKVSRHLQHDPKPSASGGGAMASRDMPLAAWGGTPALAQVHMAALCVR